MANTKASSFASKTGAQTASNDLFPFLDVSAVGALQNSVITRAELIIALGLVIGTNVQAYNSILDNIVADTANTLALRNSTTAQSLRVYNTYTSSTNKEYLEFNFSSNIAQILTVAGSSGGTTRALTVGGGSSVGTNIAGATTYIAGGRSTGNGTEGSIIFQTNNTGSSGSSANALVNKWIIESSRLRPATNYSLDIGSSSYAVNNIYCGVIYTSNAYSPSGGIITTSIGQLIDFYGVTIPSGYILANGASVGVATYGTLDTELKITQAGSATGAVVTIVDTSVLQVGWTVAGTNIANGTTILSIDDSTTITMSAAIGFDGSQDFHFYPYGTPDNGTNFTLPNVSNSSSLGYKLIRYQ